MKYPEPEPPLENLEITVPENILLELTMPEYPEFTVPENRKLPENRAAV